MEKNLGEETNKIEESYAVRQFNHLKLLSLTDGFCSKRMLFQDLFYGAPSVIFIFMSWSDEECKHYTFTVAGLSLENLHLSAFNLGLGTCTNGLSRYGEDTIRYHLQPPENELYTLAVAIGYPMEKKTNTRNDPEIHWIRK